MFIVYTGAFLLDLLIGDPVWLPHPVRWLGWLIAKLESILFKLRSVRFGLYPAGFILTALVVGCAYFITFFLLKLLAAISPWLATVFSIWLLFSTIACKSLGQAGLHVLSALRQGDLYEARKRLAQIVGRDTENLTEAEIVRGTVETIAENLVDGITSPLFYAFIGGVPLAMAYRAVNTLDSMVGYKSERYQQFGYASAKLDDLANYLPARLTIIFLLAAAWIAGWDFRNSLVILRRDAKKHPSPNSGICEAIVAGGLHIQLGGLNYYQGIPNKRATMGDPCRPLAAEDILKCITGIRLASVLFFIAGFMILYLFFTFGRG